MKTQRKLLDRILEQTQKKGLKLNILFPYSVELLASGQIQSEVFRPAGIVGPPEGIAGDWPRPKTKRRKAE